MSRRKDGRDKEASSSTREVRIEVLDAILEHADKGLTGEEIELLRNVVVTLAAITSELEAKDVSVKRLRRLLFGPGTEKQRNLFPKDDAQPAGESQESANDSDGDGSKQDSTPTGTPSPVDPAGGCGSEDKAAKAQNGQDAPKRKKRRGHGRISSAQYTGARRIPVSHGNCSHGGLCPTCSDGKSKLYRLLEPARVIRVTGMAPIGAIIWEKERLRCGTCGGIFTAPSPEGIGEEKYDESVAAMVAVFRYGAGIPFYRLEKLQKNLGIPLPAGTQWDLVDDAFEQITPVYDELIREAAQGDVLYNDDTTMTILDLPPTSRRKETQDIGSHSGTGTSQMAPNGEPATGTAATTESATHEISDSRKGTFTSGIISTKGERRIAMFFTGRRHAGENLAAILARRAAELDPPIQMSDGLDRNKPPGFETIWANCLAHARRKYVDVVDAFPKDSEHILKTLGKVYHFDQQARDGAMSPQQRLAWHQTHSGPLMAELRKWFDEQFELKTIEPNSELGKAIRYMTKPSRWERLTLFLRVPGAPLDNDICERAIKKSILHRKNSMFYKTEHGAEVGDLFMSMVHTCELNGVDPFHYLVALLSNEQDLVSQPARWMPWNYKDRLAELAREHATS